jgi:aminopeptidase YwaD
MLFISGGINFHRFLFLDKLHLINFAILHNTCYILLKMNIKPLKYFSLALMLQGAFITTSQAQIWNKVLPKKNANTSSAVASTIADENPEAVIKQLRNDVGFLASDKLEGRRTGTKGEALAADFIISRMRQIGLSTLKGSYKQPFKFDWGRELTPETRLTISGKYVSVPEDAFPATFSAAGSIDNFVLTDHAENASPWLVPLYEKEADAGNPHFDLEKSLFTRAKLAQDRGATAVFFYNAFDSKYSPVYSKRSAVELLKIPVIILNKKAYDTHIKDMKTLQPIMLNLTFRKEQRTGTNIVGYINNNAEKTVVIGAHYDHLGYGEDGSSRYAGTDKAIHNGADDNASGVGALLAIADKVKRNVTLKKYNYLFIAFSAEELGLLGSKAIVNDANFSAASISYMLNLDMVGRLNAERKLSVGGVGTAPVWGTVLNSFKTNFKLSYDSSGLGPSDHASFYSVNIPVLFFFTGTHTDYHKPSDDADKINYVGIKDIVNYTSAIIGKMETMAPPKFTVTKKQSASRSGFKVTLGIMPDYSYQEGGIKVDGVLEEKPAQKAGILKDDIILQIGNIKIEGMQSYMEALGAFNPGEHTKVKVKRGSTVQEFDLTF